MYDFRKKGLFVTGTDTGVGKTLVSGGLVRLARNHGFAAVAVKPVETGCEAVDGTLFPQDGAFLRRAAENALTLDQCAPLRFSLPASPARAATAEGVEIDVDALLQHIASIQAAADLTLVEGAGGLMVPIQGKFMMLDLVERLGYPALIVARTRLGTVNHTLLTVAALRSRGVGIAGIALSASSEEVGPEESHTPSDIAALAPDVPVSVMPRLDPGVCADPEALARVIERDIEASVWKNWIGDTGAP